MNPIAYDYHVILPRADQPQILLLQDANGGWSLPHFELQGHHESSEVSQVNERIRDLLGISVTTLRCLYFNYEPLSSRVSALFLLESLAHDWLPPSGACWAGREELTSLKLSGPGQRIFLESWLAEKEAGSIPPGRVPWAREGWFEEAAGWIKKELAGKGLALAGPIEQRRNWFRSSILRARTSGPDLYFKAGPPQVFGCEAALTSRLAQKYPAKLPRLLAVEAARNWLLMEDFGKVTLSEIKDAARWAEALRGYALIQIEQIEEVDQLLALGCPDLRLAVMEASVDELLADPLLPLTGRQWSRLSELELAELRGLIPSLKRMCARLKSYGLPETLDHGDLHDRNIIVTERDCLYFDWSDACLTHPFFGLSIFFRFQEFENFLPDVPRVRERLRDAFLSPWTSFGPMRSLVEAYELAYSLAPLHHALLYQRVILPKLEQAARWETDNMLPFWLRTLLKQKAEILRAGA
ncbi:MAG TPA: phosphotransferase [Pyrinomonadaceae bacterium]|jgi:hypothetical protein